MDAADEELRAKGEELGLAVFDFKEIVDYGDKVSDQEVVLEGLENLMPDDIEFFCYTSGTTGNPKGAKLSHKYFFCCIRSCMDIYSEMYTHDDTHISYLPLAHIYEKCNMNFVTYVGGSAGFYGGDPLKLTEDMQILKPTIFPTVPRLLSKVYDTIMSRVEGGGWLKKTLFGWGRSSKVDSYRSSGELHSGIYDKLIFNKLKDLLGGRVKMMITASAPINKDVLDFFKVAFQCQIAEGYGLTETGLATITHPKDHLGGSVGGVGSTAKIKLLDVADMNYLSTDFPNPRGEVLIGGGQIFSGYYKNPEKTEEALDADGWVHTGDIGEILPNGAIRIIDRAKNIFKLSQGEYVAPEKLENIYVQSHFVTQMFVHGTSTESVLVAVATIDTAVCGNWAEAHGVANDASLQNNEELIAEIMADFTRLHKENALNGIEKIKGLTLCSEQFTVENGLLTPTFKLKRFNARDFFQAAIAEMYEKFYDSMAKK